MILTQCAVCATELGLSLGKKCGRCSTRYCGAACQVQHWKEGGHDKLCRKIKKAGGAEQYNANQKYTEAVSVAVVICAEDTKGQTCYICTQALHWKTKEGLVRGCACRGTAGFAQVSCLAEQAKILVAEAVMSLKHFEEAKSLLRRMLPVVRRSLRENDVLILKMRLNYGRALHFNDCATLDDLHEAVTMFEETARTARRVLGSAHPTTTGIENGLQKARTVLHASETRDMLAAAARTFARG